MPTFLNKILGVFSTNAATELNDSGVDFVELSASDLSNYSIDVDEKESRNVFIASCTAPGPTLALFSVFLSDGVIPLSSAKVFKVFTSKEETVVNETAATLYDQLEPFIDVGTQGRRPFFSSSSVVREFAVTALLHPDWTSAHIMAAIPRISFVDPKSLYPKSAIHHKMNIQSPKTGVTPLMVALDMKNIAFVIEAVSPTGALRDVVEFTLVDKNMRNYIYYAVTFHINCFPTTEPEREKDAILARICGNYTDGARMVDSEGRSAVHLAVAAKRLDVLRFLVNRCINALEHNPESKASLLHVAAEVGVLEVVQYLLEHAPELVLLKDAKYNATPLHWATTLEVTDALFDAGCDPDQLSSSGETAIHVALRYDRLAVVSALIAFAAKTDVVATGGRAPLHMAVAKPCRVIAEMLIAYGADVNIKDSAGDTPRHLAAVGAQPPPEPDNSSAPASVRLTNALYSMAGLVRDDDDRKKREECENILALLHYVGARRCPPGRAGCTAGCIDGGKFDGVLPPGYPSFPITDRCVAESPAATMIDKLLSDNALASYAANPEQYKDRIRMLCLDGGGIRGLMTVLLLRHLEALVGYPIVECFDFICGTSVGGLVALFLVYGRPYGPLFAPFSHDPLTNMQRLAYQMRRKVFVGSRPYSTSQLETLLKKAFGEETVFSSTSSPMVCVTSVLANRFPAELYLFRNYSSAIELYEQAHPIPSNRPPVSELLKSPVAASAGALPTSTTTVSQPTGNTITAPVVGGGGATVSPSNSMIHLSDTGSVSFSQAMSSPSRSMSPPPTISVLSSSAAVFTAGSPPTSASSPMAAAAASGSQHSEDQRGLVWKAARSTGAAPTYFRASGNFIDGGVMANNPTLDALTDVHQLAAVIKAIGCGDDAADRYRVGLVLSIGTGREVQHETPVADLRRPEGIIDMTGLYKSVLAFINLLVDQATVADGRPVDRSRAWCAQMDALYYRLSPLFSHHVELDEHDDALLVRALYETRAYMHYNADQFNQLAGVLRELAEARGGGVLHHLNKSDVMSVDSDKQ